MSDSTTTTAAASTSTSSLFEIWHQIVNGPDSAANMADFAASIPEMITEHLNVVNDFVKDFKKFIERQSQSPILPPELTNKANELLAFGTQLQTKLKHFNVKRDGVEPFLHLCEEGGLLGENLKAWYDEYDKQRDVIFKAQLEEMARLTKSVLAHVKSLKPHDDK